MHPKNPTQAPIINSSCPKLSNLTLITLQTKIFTVAIKNPKQLPLALPSILRTRLEISSKLPIFVQAHADKEAPNKVTAIANALIGPKAENAICKLRPALDLIRRGVNTNQLARLFEASWSAGTVTHPVHHGIFGLSNPALWISSCLHTAGPTALKEQGDDRTSHAASFLLKILSKDCMWI